MSDLRGTGNVLGVGIDLIEVDRIQRAVARWGEAFLERVFTPREIADCGTGRSRHQRLAARFCAKEAVFKALGRERRGFRWRDVEVVRTPSGRPETVLAGRALECARELGVTEVLVTLSHLPRLAAAEAVCLGHRQQGPRQASRSRGS